MRIAVQTGIYLVDLDIRYPERDPGELSLGHLPLGLHAGKDLRRRAECIGGERDLGSGFDQSAVLNQNTVLSGTRMDVVAIQCQAHAVFESLNIGKGMGQIGLFTRQIAKPAIGIDRFR